MYLGKYSLLKVHKITIPSRKQIIKACVRKNKWKCAIESLKDPVIRHYIIKKLLTWVNKELKCLCSSKVNSFLQSFDVTGFSRDAVHAQLKSHAPLFLAFMQVCTQTKKPRKNNSTVLGMYTAILLKHRCKEMNLEQKVLSLVLYVGNARKQVLLNFIILAVHMLRMNHVCIKF